MFYNIQYNPWDETRMAAKAQESAAKKHEHSVVVSTATTTSSFDDDALQPPPSKHSKKEPSQVFTFKSSPKRSHCYIKNKEANKVPTCRLVSITYVHYSWRNFQI